MHPPRTPPLIPRGFTLTEIVTALVALGVLAAITIVTWHSHELRERRNDAIEALLALQAAQDQYFGEHARYADETKLGSAPPAGLGIRLTSRLGYYAITVRNSGDALGYSATARVIRRADETPDTRCVELRIDQNGRRFALDAAGEDRSADCWH